MDALRWGLGGVESRKPIDTMGRRPEGVLLERSIGATLSSEIANSRVCLVLEFSAGKFPPMKIAAREAARWRH